MRRFSLHVVLVLLAGWLVSPVFAATGMFAQVGQVAPSFHLQDQNGHWHAPADFHGQWRVLYFYPKHFTSGCTTFLIDPAGRVAKICRDVGPKAHSSQVLRDLASLKKVAS